MMMNECIVLILVALLSFGSARTIIVRWYWPVHFEGLAPPVLWRSWSHFTATLCRSVAFFFADWENCFNCSTFTSSGFGQPKTLNHSSQKAELTLWYGCSWNVVIRFVLFWLVFLLLFRLKLLFILAIFLCLLFFVLPPFCLYNNHRKMKSFLKQNKYQNLLLAGLSLINSTPIFGKLKSYLHVVLRFLLDVTEFSVQFHSPKAAPVL